MLSTARYSRSGELVKSDRSAGEVSGVRGQEERIRCVMCVGVEVG